MTDQVTALVARINAAGIWLGVWDCPEGMAGTFSRREFIDDAKARGIISDDEEHFLRSYWSGILDFDLSD